MKPTMDEMKALRDQFIQSNPSSFVLVMLNAAIAAGATISLDIHWRVYLDGEMYTFNECDEIIRFLKNRQK